MTTRPIIMVAGRRIIIDLPHLLFATLIAGWCVWFCRDAWLSRADVENLILIVPASAAAILLYGFVVADCIQAAGGADNQAAPRPPLATGFLLKVVGSMIILAFYVVGAPLIGFDVASFAYMLAMLVFLGERRWPILLLAPSLFSAAVIYGFNHLLATPLPLLLFAGDAG
jgi:hypothetical protein